MGSEFTINKLQTREVQTSLTATEEQQFFFFFFVWWRLSDAVTFLSKCVCVCVSMMFALLWMCVKDPEAEELKEKCQAIIGLQGPVMD